LDIAFGWTATGCVRAGFGPPGSATTDAARSDADASPPPAADGTSADDGAYDALPVFASARPIAELNTSGEEQDPHLSADGLRLYFVIDRGAGHLRDLVVAERATLSTPFAALVPVAGVNTADNEQGVSLTADELIIAFERVPATTTAGDGIYLAERRTRQQAFGAPVRLDVFDSVLRQAANPSLSADGLSLLFDGVALGGGGDRDLWLADRPSRAVSFSAPRPLLWLEQHERSTRSAGYSERNGSRFNGVGPGAISLFRRRRARVRPSKRTPAKQTRRTATLPALWSMGPRVALGWPF